MDDDRVIVFDVEHADLEKCSVGCWADEHDQVIIQDHSSHGVAKGVPYVRVSDPVLSRWLVDPHLDNIACLKALGPAGEGSRSKSADRYEMSSLAA
jgi:hypothetical protein